MKLLNLILVIAIFCSCDHIASIGEPPNLTFENIKGIKYHEVRREFDNGISFDKYGFQLEPEWDVFFTGDDSVKIYSREKESFMPYRIFHSHKNLFQFARRWFRLKHVDRDSILLQAMEVNGRAINEDGSNIFMKLYSDSYIKNSLKTTAEQLRRPTALDSVFVKYRATQASSNPDSIFAARMPVQFKSRSKILTVEKLEPRLDPNLGELSSQVSYLNPVYRIKINKAYKDFTYSFYMNVDYRGRMTFRRFNFSLMPEFIENETKIAKAIIDVYFKNLIEVTPGNTLGYPHPTTVEIFVTGTKEVL